MRKPLAGIIGVSAAALGVLARLLMRFGPGLLAVCLVSYGAWLAWPPAGFISAGGLLLIDLVWGRVRAERRPPA